MRDRGIYKQLVPVALNSRVEEAEDEEKQRRKKNKSKGRSSRNYDDREVVHGISLLVNM